MDPTKETPGAWTKDEEHLVTEVLRRVRGQVHGLMDVHGVESGAAAVESVAAELGIDLGPMEEE